MTTRIYDSNEVAIAVGGIPIEGYADGQFLSITRTSDGFTTVVGTDGTVARSKTNDHRAIIEIALLQTSPSNLTFTALWNADRRAPGGAGIFAFLCTDLNGTSLYTSGNAWVQKGPDITMDREATSRTWVLECDNLQDFTGGNL
jgi:hypothetical protein